MADRLSQLQDAVNQVSYIFSIDIIEYLFKFLKVN